MVRTVRITCTRRNIAGVLNAGHGGIIGYAATGSGVKDADKKGYSTGDG